jgi:hypothetical protein
MENILNEFEFAKISDVSNPLRRSPMFVSSRPLVLRVGILQSFGVIGPKESDIAPSRPRVLGVGILQAFGVIGPIGRKVGLANQFSIGIVMENIVNPSAYGGLAKGRSP